MHRGLSGVNHRVGIWLGLSLLWLGGCGGETPLTTNPISDGIPGRRVATPDTQGFAELGRGRQAQSKHLVASFLLDPDQVEAAASQEIRLAPREIALCLQNCTDPALEPAQIPAEEAADGLGTYTPDDWQLLLRFNLPERDPLGTVEMDVRVALNTQTQFLTPGSDVRLTLKAAYLQNSASAPTQSVAARRISDPLDFDAKDITQGTSNTQTLSLTFETTTAFDPRYLRLEAVLTSPIPDDALLRGKIAVPPEGKLYHGVAFPEGQPSPEQVQAYREQAGKAAAWVGFTQHWADQRSFPVETATWIRSAGAIPYLWLQLPQQAPDPDTPEASSLLEQILEGELDEEWKAWTEAVKTFASPIMVAVGPVDVENRAEATQRQALYQHVIRLVREQQVDNILWVYHPQVGSPEFAADFPGDTFIDWLGLSLAVEPPPSGEWPSLRDQLDQIYAQAAAVSPRKPILLATLGPTTPPDPSDAGLVWLQTAFQDLLDLRWPRLIGFSWLESGWSVSASPELAAALTERIAESEQVLGQVITQPSSSASPLPEAPATDTPDPALSPPGEAPAPPKPDPPAALSEPAQPPTKGSD